jgi:hypothetical protein
MTTATPAAGDYDAYAGQYTAFVARREEAGPEADPYGLLSPLLDLLGDIASPTGTSPDYFDSGAVSRYRGLWEAGIQTYYHHRTLGNYLDASCSWRSINPESKSSSRTVPRFASTRRSSHV